ncbi:MAG: adenylate/guanylate cyclase domain-containing protein [Acidobacteriota bacterium]
MSDFRRDLAAFVPRSLWPLLGSAEGAHRTEGCLLFADLAGFTAMTERLAAIGREGAEELTRVLNDFFAAMIAIVHEEGGDVLRFGGDAMTLLFPPDLSGALRAALRMHEEIRRFQSISTRGGEFSLAMKTGISVGSLLIGTVGDQETGRDYFAAGSALDEAAEAEHRASRGQVLLGPSCRAGLPIDCRVEEAGDGFLLLSGSDGLHRTPEPDGTQRSPLPSRESLEAFLPRFVQARAGTGRGHTVAEHRRTAVLFLAFRGIDYDLDAEAVDRCRRVYRIIAETVRKYGGHVNKLDMGDKGSKAICCFGVPYALERQEEMACRAALELVGSATLRELLAEVRIGITVSGLFAAFVGCETRREYTVMGAGINLAARLMQNAHAWRVLASREVAEEAGGALVFRELDPVFVKGIGERVRVFRPEGERQAEEERLAEYVGREDLLGELGPLLADPSKPLALAVTGEAGVGKSALLHRLGLGLDAAGIRHITVPLVPYSSESYLSAWTPVLFSCLGVSRTSGEALRLEALRQGMAAEDPDFLCLMAPLLGLAMEETAAVKALSAKERKEAAFAMLARLFLRQAAQEPYGLFVDHLEHADPASLEFLAALLAELEETPLKLLLAFRSSATAAVGEAAAGLRTVRLEPLSEEEVREFLTRAGGMAAPPEAFTRFVMEKTRGNPKFIQQVLAVLAHQGLLAKGPSGLLEVDEDRLTASAFPDTLEGVLLTQVEGLPEEERHLLKTASVLGASFSVSLLARVRALRELEAEERVRALSEKGLLRLDASGRRPYATFADSLLRDALYESLTFSAKRAVHAQVAAFLEDQEGGDRRTWPYLAHHFEAAGEDGKAAHYLWLAAQDARDRYDNGAAFNLLERYIRLREKHGVSAGDDEQCRRGLMELAKTSKDLGRLDETEARCRQIIQETGKLCPELVDARMHVAGCHRSRGELDASIQEYDQAMSLARELGDDQLRCRILLDSAVPLAMSGRMNEAMEQFKQAERLARRIGAHGSLVYALMNQGLAHYYQGRLKEAKRVLQASLNQARAYGLRPNMVSITINLALVLYELGDYRKALLIDREGLAVARQFGYRDLYVSALSNQALYQTMLGLWDEAEKTVSSSLTMSQHYGMRYFYAANLHTLGMLHFVNGNFAKALVCQRESVDLYLESCATGEALACTNEILAIANHLCAPALAVTSTNEVVPWVRDELDHREKAWTIGFRAQDALLQYAEKKIDYGRANEELENALNQAQVSENLWLVAEVADALVSFLIKADQSSRAALTAMDILPRLSPHHGVWRGTLFLLTAGEALQDVGRFPDVMLVLRLLQPYAGSLDRGLAGLRYRRLRALASARAGKKRSASFWRQSALKLLNEIEARNPNKEIREAITALPEVRELRGGTPA